MEQETLKAVKDLVQTVGFPIVVACWLLWRTDARIDAMRRALEDFTDEFRGTPRRK